MAAAAGADGAALAAALKEAAECGETLQVARMAPALLVMRARFGEEALAMHWALMTEGSAWNGHDDSVRLLLALADSAGIAVAPCLALSRWARVPLYLMPIVMAMTMANVDVMPLASHPSIDLESLLQLADWLEGGCDGRVAVRGSALPGHAQLFERAWCACNEASGGYSPLPEAARAAVAATGLTGAELRRLDTDYVTAVCRWHGERSRADVAAAVRRALADPSTLALELVHKTNARA